MKCSLSSHIFLIVFFTLVAAASCSGARDFSHSSTEESSVRVVRDTVRLVSQQHDTLVFRDSVFRLERLDGCTVRIETERWRTQWRTLTMRDTVLRVVRDTARVSEKTETVKETMTTNNVGLKLFIVALALAVTLSVVMLFKYKRPE